MVQINLFLPQLWMLFVRLCRVQVWVTTFWTPLVTFFCRSLWDRVCCQDWHTDRNGCILAVCFAPSVVQWGSWPHCTKFSVWLDCVRLFIIGRLSVSLQCISSAVVCKCLWWHCQVLLGTGVSWYYLRRLGVCSWFCVAGIWKFRWFCRWAIWGQVALAPWVIITSTK